MRDAVAILCSGQGNQNRDMFSLVADQREAEPVFAAAATHLDGVDPREFVAKANLEALFSNHSGQILCCTQALAVWTVTRSALPARVMIMGYSVGELAAWGCAGVFEADRTLALAARRAKLMDAATPPGAGLAGIVGLSRPAIDALTQRYGVFVAIINGADSFVIGGRSKELDDAVAAAAAQGAVRAHRLRVAVPSHTPLLDAAAEDFEKVLAQEEMRPCTPGVTLLCGLDGSAIGDPARDYRRLSSQIAHHIDWQACLEALSEYNAVAALELGPGTALSRITASLLPNFPCRSAADFRTINGIRAWFLKARQR